MSRWGVLGSDGALGSEFCRLLKRRGEVFAAFDIPLLDITDSARLCETLKHLSPEIVVNCAAWTNVDGAESNVPASRAVNVEAPGEMACICGDFGAKLVHFSTDFVFDGGASSPYSEGSVPNPISEYGRGKLLGEQAVLAGNGDHLVIRTAWLYGHTGTSFVEKMALLAAERDELKVVTDQVGSPTYARDLAEGALALIVAGGSGLFNFVNAGQASRYELVEEIIRLTGTTCRLVEATTDDFPAPAARPRYSVLSTEHFTSATGIEPRGWREALGDRLCEPIIYEKEIV